ncbi:hypothetical protein D0Y65_041524 [Glycine soja]|uniref:Endonuclease/exonuclease/phosphatase domain-containing protein n=1 Tax=Glycine soja TaxID=3848 RepID=A0A445GW16_GLYSO|nr:hypothetical protein D0Y65_041524 [Glycine soja]
MWEMQPAINSAGDILCMWTESVFRLQNKVTGIGFILLEGVCTREALKICILTVYSPCDIHNKRLLWNSVRQLKQASQVRLWCVLGDFNCIRNPNERMGKIDRSVGDNSMQEFNEWIEDMELLEVPNVGRQYTWFRPNGESKSRLDRALISPEWRDTWPENVQFTLSRNVSDHCPILIKANNVDWGPKPFRILNCWLTDKSFSDVVKHCWNYVQVPGWGAYVLKEKFKRVNVNRNRNSIKGLLIEGVWTDDPNKVKEEIRSFFSNRFLEADFQRPKIDGIFFKSLDHQHVQVANTTEVEVKTAERGFIMLEGVWMAEMQRVVVANIYAPCEIESKRQLWEKLYSRKSQSQIQSWCLVGDFNCIRHPAERLGSRHSNSEANLIAKLLYFGRNCIPNVHDVYWNTNSQASIHVMETEDNP